MPSSRFYSFIRKGQICVGPRVLLDYHGGTQQLERGRSAGAKSSSYHSVQKELVTGTGAHPPGPDVRTLETLGRCWVDQALASSCAAQLQRNTKGGGSPAMLALGHTPIWTWLCGEYSESQETTLVARVATSWAGARPGLYLSSSNAEDTGLHFSHF